MHENKLVAFFRSDLMNKSLFGKFYYFLSLTVFVSGFLLGVPFLFAGLVLFFLGFCYDDKKVRRKENRKAKEHWEREGKSKEDWEGWGGK